MFPFENFYRNPYCIKIDIISSVYCFCTLNDEHFITYNAVGASSVDFSYFGVVDVEWYVEQTIWIGFNMHIGFIHKKLFNIHRLNNAMTSFKGIRSASAEYLSFISISVVDFWMSKHFSISVHAAWPQIIRPNGYSNFHLVSFFLLLSNPIHKVAHIFVLLFDPSNLNSCLHIQNLIFKWKRQTKANRKNNKQYDKHTRSYG